jgi:hypothetical protein
VRLLAQERSPWEAATLAGWTDARLAHDLRTVVADTFRPSPLSSPAICW